MGTEWGGLETLLAAAKFVESQEQEKNQKLIEICEEYPSSEKTFPTDHVLPIPNSVVATTLTSTTSVAPKGVHLQNTSTAATAYVPECGAYLSNDVTSSTVPSLATTFSNGSSLTSVIVPTLPSFSPTPSLTFTFTTPTAVNQTASLLKISPPIRLPSSVPSPHHQPSPLVIQRHNVSYSPPPPSQPSAPLTAARPLPHQQTQSQQSQPPSASLSNAVPTVTVLSQRTFTDRAPAVNDMKRKLSNSGTREVHNKLEKNRRAHLKECFELLKNQVPAIQDEKKPSNLTILRTAIRYVQILRKREEELGNELERLSREKIVNQQRMTTLKKELSAQWGHLNIDTLIPDSVEPSKPVDSAENGPEHRRDYENEVDADKLTMSDVDDSQSQPKSKGGGTYYGSSSSSGSCSISPLHISSPDVISTTSDGLPPQIHIVESAAVSFDKLSNTSVVSPLQFLSTSTLRMIADGDQPMALVQHNGGEKSTESATLPKMAVHPASTFAIFSDSFSKVVAASNSASGSSSVTTVSSTKLAHPTQFTHGITLPTVSMNHKNVSLAVKPSFSQCTPNGAIASANVGERNSSTVLTTVPVHTTVRSLANHSFVVSQPSSGQMLLTSTSSHLQTNVMPTPLLKTVSKLQPINGHHQLVVKPTTMVVVSSSATSK